MGLSPRKYGIMISLVLLSALMASAYGAAIPLTNLNIPAPIPAGQATGEHVQRIPIQAFSRSHTIYTPQITKSVPNVRIVEQSYEVEVPKPVYQTKQITPVHTNYVAQPYAVPEAFPVPVTQNIPVHVGHEVNAIPVSRQYTGLAIGQHFAGVPVAHQYTGLHSANFPVAGHQSTTLVNTSD